MADNVGDKAAVLEAWRAAGNAAATVTKEMCDILSEVATLGDMELDTSQVIVFEKQQNGSIKTEVDTKEPKVEPLRFRLSFVGKPPTPKVDA
jgi:hypothetical protein